VEVGHEASILPEDRRREWRTVEPGTPTRVSTLELFFDLVFVFTITQLTTVLQKRPTLLGLLQVSLMLGVIWWMYSGYAWLTNAVPPDRLSRRLPLLGGMAAYLVLALAIPHAFSGSGTAFGLAYLAIVLLHATLFMRSSSEGVVAAILRLAPFNLATALLVLAGGIAGGTAAYVLLGIAVVAEWISPFLSKVDGFVIGTEHFVERHGLVVLIAIGESVVAVGVGVHALSIDLELVAIVVAGLALSACLWWAYFGGDDERAEHALREAPASRRAQLGVNAFGYCHLLILLGIIAVAAAVHDATAHAFDELPAARALTLAGGVAVYLVGEVLFRYSLGIGRGGWRLACAAAVLLTIPLGTAIAAEAQIVAVVALLVACFALEARATPPAGV
jgi:low temperature requirement protein LtrA